MLEELEALGSLSHKQWDFSTWPTEAQDGMSLQNIIKLQTCFFVVSAAPWDVKASRHYPKLFLRPAFWTWALTGSQGIHRTKGTLIISDALCRLRIKVAC
jgi:hypothetical protein